MSVKKKTLDTSVNKLVWATHFIFFVVKPLLSPFSASLILSAHLLPLSLLPVLNALSEKLQIFIYTRVSMADIFGKHSLT